MTQQEFETRTIPVTVEEFKAINEVYMNCTIGKDEFCKQWCKMNKERVSRYKAAEKKRIEEADLRWKVSEINFNKFGYNCCDIAANRLSKREIALLEKAGIEMENKKAIPYVNSKGVIDYLPKMKLVYEVEFEIRKYLEIA